MRGINNVNDLKMIEVLFNIFQDQQNWEAQILCFPILLVLKIWGTMLPTAFTMSQELKKQPVINTIARQPSMATIAIARSAFGGDDKWQRATCPRAASAHLHGQMFENCLIQSNNFRTFGHGDDEKYDERSIGISFHRRPLCLRITCINCSMNTLYSLNNTCGRYHVVTVTTLQ